MKVLWITNIVLPEAIQLLTGSGELKASGGWLLGAANAILKDNNTLNLSIATVSPMVKSFTKLKGRQITYYILPIGRGNEHVNLEYCKYWKKIEAEVRPDVVHIHGTEYSHGHAYLKVCSSNNVVVSIQGLISSYYKYYFAGVTIRDIYKNLTLYDILRGSMLRGRLKFKKRGQYETETLQMTHHIIGRTSWDRALTWAINPNAEYHFCNETLRPEFYGGESWEYKKCTKHTIFLSQSGYAIKGLHQVLKAMPTILKYYPDAKIRVAGYDITKCSNLYECLRYSGYGRYIKSIIRKSGLQDKIVFTGNLNGEQMKREYLNANVFVCPSSIENSPNSLGEAQLLGTPCVASYVGGIPDLMKGNEENIYRFEEVDMLAEKICNIFAHEEKQINMQKIASDRHNANINAENLIRIYNSIRK